MKQAPIIAASLLSANLARLGEDSEAVLAAGANWLHFDVMDNHYVPNLTFGPALCQSLRNYGITAFIDVHLMVRPVDHLITQFAKAGASSISFHPEASENIDKSLQLIKENRCQAGIAFNPDMPLVLPPHILEKIDLILIMSVNPGFAGQKFIPSVLNKIEEARKLIDKSNRLIRLEVDGGIKLNNIREVATAGADTFVAGSAIFGSENYYKTLAAFSEQIL